MKTLDLSRSHLENPESNYERTNNEITPPSQLRLVTGRVITELAKGSMADFHLDLNEEEWKAVVGNDSPELRDLFLTELQAISKEMHEQAEDIYFNRALENLTNYRPALRRVANGNSYEYFLDFHLVKGA